MRIGILNGETRDGDTELSQRLSALARRLIAAGHEVERLNLRDMEVRSCTGCWSCWWKTPGRCALVDDGDAVRRAWLRSDLLLFASPLLLGFPSALLKDAIDKLIPNALPFIRLGRSAEGRVECRHAPRYDRQPVLACLLEPGADDDDADVAIATRWFARLADQFHSPFAWGYTTTTAPDVLLEAINATAREATR